MATGREFVDDVLETLAPLDVRARAMFGEYALYCDDKVVALICDHRVYLKPITAVDWLGFDLEAGPPYPGAKDHWIVDDRVLARAADFKRLVQATANARPAPKTKKNAKKKPQKKADKATRRKPSK